MDKITTDNLKSRVQCKTKIDKELKKSILIFPKGKHITILPKNFFAYSRNISLSYYLKTKEKFYTQFSYISYNPYMFPKHISNSKKYMGYRKSFFFKYIVLYKIFDDYVKILNIYHSKSNYSKVV